MYTLTSNRTALRTHEPDRIRRSPLDFIALFLSVLLLSVIGLFVFWQVWHTYRIYTGVTVAGVSVGGLTRAAALDRLSRNLVRYPLPPVTLEYEGRQWPITVDDARATADLLDAVNQAYLVGRLGSLGDRLVVQLLAATGGLDITPSYSVDEGQVRQAVARIAAQVHAAPRPAIELGGVSVPAELGREVDIEATVRDVMAMLQDGGPGKAMTAPLRVAMVEPPAEPGTDSSAVASVPLATRQPLLLRDDRTGLEMALDPATLNEIAPLPADPSAAPVIDESRLTAILTTWAAQFDLPSQDARLRFDPATLSVSVLQPSRAGRRLDIEATRNGIITALTNGAAHAPLVVEEVAPAVDMNRIAEMGIRELVATGTTYFAGSSPERVRNIEVGASKLDGVVIPPNGIFSFNKYVEDVSAANGFEDSLIIWGDRTAVGVGGGICQVSTTVFRAAFYGGMPLVERYNHGYIVDWYGAPGLDATIFSPSVDFRFRNDTDAYLLIQPVVDTRAGEITFNFYGTKPDRQVIVGEPVQSDIVQPEAPVYTVDETLAAGQRKQVEWAKPGMTVTVERTIIENGQTRTEKLVSKYVPWKAVYLVAPDVAAPTLPTPTPAPPGSEETAAVEVPVS